MNSSIKLAYRQYLNTEAGALSYREFQRALYTDDDSLVNTINNSVLQCLSALSRDALNICDIGGGDGRRIRKILRFLHEKFCLTFRLDFVEQSAWLIRQFEPDDIRPFSDTQAFGSLFEDVDLPVKYDILFLIHSIFAFETEATIQKLLSLCSPGGVIVVVSNAQDSFLAGLKAILDAGYSDKRFEIADLLASLDARRIPNQIMSFDTRWAVPEKGLDRHMEVLLTWLSLGKLECLSQSQREEVREYLLRNSTALGRRVGFTEREVVVVATP